MVGASQAQGLSLLLYGKRVSDLQAASHPAGLTGSRSPDNTKHGAAVRAQTHSRRAGAQGDQPVGPRQVHRAAAVRVPAQLQRPRRVHQGEGPGSAAHQPCELLEVARCTAVMQADASQASGAVLPDVV